MKVDDAGVVGLHNIRGQEKAAGDVPADLAGHIVPLDGVHRGVFVAVLLLGLLVVALDEGENFVVGGVALADEGAGVAVGDVALGRLEGAVGHDLVLHQVLNLLHGRGAVQLLAVELHGFGDPANLHRRHAAGLRDALVGHGDGRDDFGNVKTDLCAVPLDNVHGRVLLILSVNCAVTDLYLQMVIYLVMLDYSSTQDIVCIVANITFGKFSPKASAGAQGLFLQKRRRLSIVRNYQIFLKFSLRFIFRSPGGTYPRAAPHRIEQLEAGSVVF